MFWEKNKNPSVKFFTHPIFLVPFNKIIIYYTIQKL